MNVYLRPWTLDMQDATRNVPHIQALDKLPSDLRAAPKRRCGKKTQLAQSSHHAAWTRYIRQHIVSVHAARTITNFLAAAECSPEDVDAEGDDAVKLPQAEVDTSCVDFSTDDIAMAGLSMKM